MGKHTSTAPDRDGLVSAITGQPIAAGGGVILDTLRPTLAGRIRRDHPGLDHAAVLSVEEVGRYRRLYVDEMLAQEKGELDALERRVAESLSNNSTIAENIESAYRDNRSVGERLSDDLATFGGSWTFLICFGAVLAVWIVVNVVLGSGRAFDAYPFILLNLILSCLAAVQAPIIMMSQRRQEAKDRLRSFNDYQVNLKAELEIRHLHEKLDHLLSRQWQRLAEIQQFQIELLEEARKPG
ncbi:MAG: DUF1003 domain-containing protein [Hyphomicrobium sp.]|nr:DUF1003 domain-containing protein [Hyphomicrobium sp.]